MRRKIRWGIVGLGKIAHSFCKDLLLVEEAVLHGVASRDTAKAKEFGATYGANICFDSYTDLFHSNEIDVVYIATPHSEHLPWAMEAMEAGKAVLCEKPLGVNRSQVETMIKCARDNKVFLMEALWSRFNPAISEAHQKINEGLVGPVRYLNADFAFYAMDRNRSGRLLNPDLAGGSLLDIGIYPVFLAYLLLGMPNEIRSSSRRDETGVEVQSAMIFEYENAMATLYSGLNSGSQMQAEISGEKGRILLLPRWHEAQGYVVSVDGKEEHMQLPTLGKGYTHEIEEVNQCVSRGAIQSDRWSHRNSLELITLLDRVREQQQIRFPFEQ